MKIPTKKLNNGFEIPIFGMGTAQFGGPDPYPPGNEEIIKNYDNKKDIFILKSAIDSGVTYIDTAELYGNGRSEETVAKAIEGYDRSKLFISSKVYPLNLHYDDVIKSAKRSIKRLKTDYLDLYIIHHPNLKIPLKETMEAFDYLAEKKFIKYIAVGGGFDIDLFKEAQSHTQNKIVLNNLQYSLIHREYQIDGFINYAQSNDIMITAWRSIQLGELTKKGIAIVDEICKKYNKTPAQIAINWVISQKNIVTVVRTTNIKHLKNDLGAIGWQMEDSDIDYLSKNFPDQKPFSEVRELPDFNYWSYVMHN
jgi:diketogulonate reductase-like aldo/keto reductase